jgi:hypothetical protein
MGSRARGEVGDWASEGGGAAPYAAATVDVSLEHAAAPSETAIAPKTMAARLILPLGAGSGDIAGRQASQNGQRFEPKRTWREHDMQRTRAMGREYRNAGGRDARQKNGRLRDYPT